MNTRRISSLAVFACALAALYPAAASAQTATPTVTLCAAITSTSQNVICLSSITSVVGQTSLFIDSEYMRVVSTPTVAGAVKVSRGIGAPGAALHANGALAYVGLTPAFAVAPGENGFVTSANASMPSGTCTRTAQAYLPKVYVNLGQVVDCDVNTAIWRPYLARGPVVVVLDTGAANAITSAVGSAPAYTGMQVQVTLAHALQAGANTFAYAGGTALAIKSSRNTGSNIATAYVSGGSVNLTLALVSTTLTWLDLSQ